MNERITKYDMAHLRRLFWGFDFEKGDPITIPICDIVGMVDATDKPPALDLNPAYQRPSVWTIEQKQAFLAHWLLGGDVSRIVLNVPYTGSSDVPNTLDEPMVVIDGKQRIEAWCEFIRGHVCAKMPAGLMVHVDRVTNARGKLPSSLDIKATRVNLPLKTQAMLYLRLNEGGTPHTEEDLERARTFVRQSD